MAESSISAAGAFRRSRWLMSAHAETIFATLSRQPSQIGYTREIIQTRDKDTIALDYVKGRSDLPLLILLHGLEGCSQSCTMRQLAFGAVEKKWTVAVPHFRGCGGLPNRHPRAYYACDAEEVSWMVSYCRAAFPHSTSFIAGVSLGGTALIHYLLRGEFTSAAATVSTPFDLSACVKKLDSGINRRLYARHFLHSLRPKVIEKIKRYPSLCDTKKLRAIRTISEFDELYTAPVHGYRSALHYWHKASVHHVLEKVPSPLLCINALNDPLIPVSTLPPPPKNSMVTVCRPAHGGHGAFLGNPDGWLFTTVYNYFQQQQRVAASAV